MPLPRYLPDEPFPPYAYVGGSFPHPTRDPAGHSYGHEPEPVTVPDPSGWRACHAYVRGLDLFNHGYYWEAHEAWESIWQACGRTGCLATFLEGLIKLAAAGVKVRQGRPHGVRRHSGRAEAHFREVRDTLSPGSRRYMGLLLDDLIAFARTVYDSAERLKGHPERPVEIVLPVVLRPE